MRSAQESEQTRLRVQLLNHVEKTHDDVVSTSGLATRQYASQLIQKQRLDFRTETNVNVDMTSSETVINRTYT